MASILQVFEQGFFGIDGRDQRVLVTISIPEGIVSPKRLSEEWILVLNMYSDSGTASSVSVLRE